ncbi:MAG: hypothetical protein PHW60_16510, partial [Kiritimatiellae bacterium]|nr:hypothetical protein [Kiritimatiellia bacterium]
WSGYPATQDVNLASHGLTLGGVTRTTWSSVDASDWSIYPANQDVDIDGYALYNVGGIELGGIMRLTWPDTSATWASAPASTNVDLAGHSVSNGTFIGIVSNGIFYGNGVGITNLAEKWAQYPAVSNVNLAGKSVSNGAYIGNGSGLTNVAERWSAYPATQTVNMANRSLANVSSISLGGVTRTNWPIYLSLSNGAYCFSPQVCIGDGFTNSYELLNLRGTDRAMIWYSIIGGTNLLSSENGCTNSYQYFTGGVVVDAWHDLTNMYSNVSNAYVYLAGNPTEMHSYVMRLTGFGFNIPSNAIITGVKGNAEFSFAAKDYLIARLYYGGISSATESTNGTATWTTNSFGGPNSTWGFGSLSVSNVNSTNFGVEFWISQPNYGGDTILARNARVTVYYSTNTTTWRSGVDYSGHFVVASDNSGTTPITVTTNGVTLNVPLSVPQISLGGTARTNWPSVSVDTNDPVYQAAITNGDMITTGSVWQVTVDPVTRKLRVWVNTNFPTPAQIGAVPTNDAQYSKAMTNLVNQYGPTSTASFANNTLTITHGTNSGASSGGPTNQIMDVDGVLWTITNAPPAAGKYVWQFDPATTTAWFVAESLSGTAVQGTYPVFKLDLGNVDGNWTDFEIKATTNNFTNLVYYFKSWTNQPGTNTDINAHVYFTDDYSADVRQWLLKSNDIPVSMHLASSNSVVGYVYFFPSHDCTWSNWMYATNTHLIWSWVRVDDIGFEQNIDATKQRWNPVRPDSWEVERIVP